MEVYYNYVTVIGWMRFCFIVTEYLLLTGTFQAILHKCIDYKQVHKIVTDIQTIICKYTNSNIRKFKQCFNILMIWIVMRIMVNNDRYWWAKVEWLIYMNYWGMDTDYLSKKHRVVSYKNKRECRQCEIVLVYWHRTL